MKRTAAGILIAAVLATAGVSAQRKYGVTVSAEKNVDFAKFKTYAWTPGGPSADKTIDAQVIAAVDRELASLGMTKVTSATPDIRVSYFTLTRTDVDLKAKPDEKGARPEQQVGTLIVAMLDPTTAKPLLRLRADKPIEAGSAGVQAAINEAVTELFAEYPTRKAGK